MTELISTISIVALPIDQIERGFNIRYGWSDENHLDVYDDGIDELVKSIQSEGFRADKPILVYEDEDEDGNLVYKIKDGQRRHTAAWEVIESFPETPLGEGLKPGEVWAYIVPKPTSTLELIKSQMNSNQSLGATRMDIAKAMSLLAEDESLGKNITSRQEAIGKEFGLVRVSVRKYLAIYQLPEVLKDWIQTTEIGSKNEDYIGLSFSVTTDIIQDFKLKDATTILLKVRDNVRDCPEKVSVFGKLVQKSYILEVAESLGFGKKKKEKESPSLSPSVATEEVADQPVSTTQPDNNSWTPESSLIDPEQNNESESEDDEQLPDFLATPKPKNGQVTKERTKASDPSTVANNGDLNNMGRVTTLINKKLKEKAGFYIVNGVHDPMTDTFHVEFPANIGLELVELISAILDPNSNPIEEIKSVNEVKQPIQESEEEFLSKLEF